MAFDTLEEMTDQAMESLKGFSERAKEQFGTPAPGLKEQSDETYVTWFQMMLARYPSQPWILPQGVAIQASPWLLALPLVEHGDEELSRYEKLTGMDFNWVRMAAGFSPKVARARRDLQFAQRGGA